VEGNALFAIAQPEPGAKLRLRIFIEQKHVDQAYRKLFQDLLDRANIPGFRKGKAPLWRIRRHLGEQAIDGGVYGDLAERALRCVLTYGDFALVRPLDFAGEEEERRAKEKQPLVTDAVVLQVRPEAFFPGFEAVELLAPETEPTAEEIDLELKQLQGTTAELVEVERKTVQKSDQIEIVLRSQVEGEEGEPEEEDQSLIVGEDRYDPPLDVNFLGHDVGETIEFDTQYPADAGDEDLAGKTVHMSADIKDLRERRVPELNDAFAKQVDENCETLEALREVLAGQVRARHEVLRDRALGAQAVRWLGQHARIDLPDSVVDKAGDDPDDEHELRAFRASLACSALLEQRGIEVTEAEVRQEYVQLGAARGIAPSALVDDELPPQLLTVFHDLVIRRKAGRIVAEAATTRVLPLSELPEQLKRELGDDAEEPEPEEQDEA
jgi:trigger factor